MLSGAGCVFDSNSRVYLDGAPGAARKLAELLEPAGIVLRQTLRRSDVGKPGVVAFLPATPGLGVKPEGYRLTAAKGQPAATPPTP